jgi:carboxyl-terminal processing protease
LKTKSIYEPLIYALLVSSGVVFGLVWNRIVHKDALNADTKIEQVMGLVESEYVDSISNIEIEDRAIGELLSSFDPHSVYIPHQFVEVASQDLKGGFEGIGIEFFMHNDTPNIVRVLKGGPAESAGLQPGDRMMLVDTLSLIGLSNTEIISAIKGRKNTSFVGTIYRPNTDKSFSKTIERGRIKTPSVYSSLVDENTVYVKVERFAEKTHSEFTSQLKAHIKTHDINRVVLDLRNNPGGYLQTAISLLDEFVNGSELLAFTQSKSGKKKEYHATNGGLCKDMKLVCLVNTRSASASEIVSGALQDLDRATIIGSRTYGKGLVQETFELKDGSQIRLTVSRYYIPSGRSIQKPYDDDGYKHLDSAELSKEGSKFTTKNGRDVKSEGGVIPDILMSSETKESFMMVTDVAAQLVDRYIDKWSTWKPETWSSSKEVHALIQQTLKDSVDYLQDVKSRLIYQMFGIEAAYAENVKSDAIILRAIEELDKPTVLVNP